MIAIRQMEEKDIPKVCSFVQAVFDQHLSSTYTEEGNHTFSLFIENQAMHKRLAEGGFGFVATCDGAIVSCIEMSKNAHICLLFTQASHQRQGLARALVEEALLYCRRGDPNVMAVSVNAAVPAAIAYRKMGFTECGSLQERNGLTFIPMIRML